MPADTYTNHRAVNKQNVTQKSSISESRNRPADPYSEGLSHWLSSSVGLSEPCGTRPRLHPEHIRPVHSGALPEAGTLIWIPFLPIQILPIHFKLSPHLILFTKLALLLVLKSLSRLLYLQGLLESSNGTFSIFTWACFVISSTGHSTERRTCFLFPNVCGRH